MDDIIDLLQIKIEKAKVALPIETQNAIAAVDWRAAILQLREKHGYTFEQLGDLELETELVLCGLLSPLDYPKELQNRMQISKAAANELVNEMNDLVFKKIREELIRNTERKKIFAHKSTEPARNAFSVADARPHDSLQRVGQAGGEKSNTQILGSHGIEIIDKTLPIPEKLELKSISPSVPGESSEQTHSILEQKISGPFQIPVVKTEHSLDNITKTTTPNPVNVKPKIPNVDPYREAPE